mmetsp:Transcript_33679/g.54828  ORF Transcript_33679/g.54828 Transcript_33679/m.54828 type:complete len:214 (+) Transcript_33679:796-1437(+)
MFVLMPMYLIIIIIIITDVGVIGIVDVGFHLFDDQLLLHARLWRLQWRHIMHMTVITAKRSQRSRLRSDHTYRFSGGCSALHSLLPKTEGPKHCFMFVGVARLSNTSATYVCFLFCLLLHERLILVQMVAVVIGTLRSQTWPQSVIRHFRFIVCVKQVGAITLTDARHRIVAIVGAIATITIRIERIQRQTRTIRGLATNVMRVTQCHIWFTR